MNALKKIFILMLLLGFSAASYAAVSDVELSSCSVFSEGEDEPAEDEEPECE